MIRISTLVENTAFKKGLQAEHGLSFHISTDAGDFLFDTGQTSSLIHNAHELEVDLTRLKTIAISHGHYDHCGGLEALLELNPNVKVLLRAEALVPKWTHNAGNLISLSQPLRNTYEQSPSRFHYIDSDIYLSPDLLLVSHINICNDFENIENRLLWQPADKHEKDPFLDEVFLLAFAQNKMHIITGCSHRGILNIVYTAQNRFPEKEIGCIIGGTHLKGRSFAYIEGIANKLDQIKFDSLDVCHCTGLEEFHLLKSHLGNKVCYAPTGHILDL